MEAGIGGRENRERAGDYGEVRVGCTLSFLAGLTTGFLSGAFAAPTGMLEVPIDGLQGGGEGKVAAANLGAVDRWFKNIFATLICDGEYLIVLFCTRNM